MKITRTPTTLTSELSVDGDLSFSGDYQITNLAEPGDDEALRKGEKDITNDEIADAAAIAYSKLNLTGLIRNADIKSNAAIAESKLSLARGTQAIYDKIATDIGTHADLLTGAHGYAMVRKTADQTVNTSASFINDTHLFIPVAINEAWVFTVYLLHIGNTTADLKVTFTIPTNASIVFRYVGDDAAGTLNEVNQAAAGNTLPIYGTTVNFLTVITGLIIVTGTAGSLQLQWAQNTSTAVDTKLLTNSCLIAHRLV